MTNNNKKITTGQIFGEVAKELGFAGSSVTRFIDYPDFYLLINHQKSVYSKKFYINVGVYFKEMLICALTEDDIGKAFKIHPSIGMHAAYRIEDFDQNKVNTQFVLDKLVEEEKMDELRVVLLNALKSMMEFIVENGDRKTIRRLNDEGKLRGLLRKEV